ncbi:MAG: DUF502 domain-containing protein [Planctomycetaceae bacterium]|nr:DUF502 domain-containing protein [Planctomycetaceae bacterium]
MRWIMKVMGQGLAALIPIAVTIWIVVWLGMFLESILANPLKGLFPGDSEVYRMGMGIAFFVVLVFFVGLLMRLWIVRGVFELIEHWIKSLPLVKTLYGAIQDVMRFVTGGASGTARGDMVVMVTMDNGWRQLGIVTRQDMDELPAALCIGARELMAVYLPFSYQLGGFTYFIERDQCTPVPGMSVEDAMRYSLMAWLGPSEKPQDVTAVIEKSRPVDPA